MRMLLLAASTLLASVSAPQKDTPAAPADPRQRALAGVSEARVALADYARELGASGHPDISFLNRFAEETRGLHEELEALARMIQPPKPRPAPSADERAQALRAQADLVAARPLAQRWVTSMRALGADAGAGREQTLAELRAALACDDPLQQLAALSAIAETADVEYDKPALRPLVLPYAASGSGALLSTALSALLVTGHEPGDVALVQSAWERDPRALHDTLLHLLKQFGEGAIEGRSEAIALEWLATYDGGNVGINGLWGARVGPALEARVIELARDPDHEIRHAAIYFGLSTFEEKSAAVVEELIAVLVDHDHNNSGRALWGLGLGVPYAQQPRVVEALIELHASRSDSKTRERCERIVREYGGEAAAARLAR